MRFRFWFEVFDLIYISLTILGLFSQHLQFMQMQYYKLYIVYAEKYDFILFHFILLSDKKSHQVDICNEKLSSTCSEKFLGIKIDNKLTFEEQVEGLCKKASLRVSAVARVSSLMRFEQRKGIFNLFVTPLFSYCPLVQMFHNRRLNNRIDHIHERALKTIYQDYIPLLKSFLQNTAP